MQEPDSSNLEEYEVCWSCGTCDIPITQRILLKAKIQTFGHDHHHPPKDVLITLCADCDCSKMEIDPYVYAECIYDRNFRR